MLPPPPNHARAKQTSDRNAQFTAIQARAAKTVLVSSKEYTDILSLHEIYSRREQLFFSLARASGVLDAVSVVPPRPASALDLSEFHSDGYIRSLKAGDSTTLDDEALEEYGLLDDCARFRGLWQHTSAVAGASLTAAELLVRKKACVAMNWGGGKHHAKKGEASGFCFVNDCVLSILCLREKFQRVLYLDIDVRELCFQSLHLN
jgi:acetoin utilization deacetylase AcuC-like enzyme